jgi:hypothetical protein
MNVLLKQGVKISLILWAVFLGSESFGTAAMAESKPSPFFQGITFPIFPGTVPQPANVPGNTTAPVYPLVEVPTPGLRTVQSNPRPRRNRVENNSEERPVRRRRQRRRVNPEG